MDTVRLIITLVKIQGWPLRQLDFVLSYPQEEVDGDIYMKLPKGFKIPNNQVKEKHCLKLLKNIYGLEQAGRVWVGRALRQSVTALCKKPDYPRASVASLMTWPLRLTAVCVAFHCGAPSERSERSEFMGSQHPGSQASVNYSKLRHRITKKQNFAQ